MSTECLEQCPKIVALNEQVGREATNSVLGQVALDRGRKTICDNAADCPGPVNEIVEVPVTESFWKEPTGETEIIMRQACVLSFSVETVPAPTPPSVRTIFSR